MLAAAIAITRSDLPAAGLRLRRSISRTPPLTAARRRIVDADLDKQVVLQKADLTALPFPDCSFDFVISWGVVMHIPEMEKALLELVRVLKPEGTLVLG